MCICGYCSCCPYFACCCSSLGSSLSVCFSSPDPSTFVGDSVRGRSTTLLSLLSLLESPTFESSAVGGGGASTIGAGGTRFVATGDAMQIRFEGGGATLPKRALLNVVPAATVSKDMSSPK